MHGLWGSGSVYSSHPEIFSLTFKDLRLPIPGRSLLLALFEYLLIEQQISATESLLYCVPADLEGGLYGLKSKDKIFFLPSCTLLLKMFERHIEPPTERLAGIGAAFQGTSFPIAILLLKANKQKPPPPTESHLIYSLYSCIPNAEYCIMSTARIPGLSCLILTD